VNAVVSLGRQFVVVRSSVAWHGRLNRDPYARLHLLGVPDTNSAAFARYGATIGSALAGPQSVPYVARLIEADRRLKRIPAQVLDHRRREPGDDIVSQLLATEGEQLAPAAAARRTAAATQRHRHPRTGRVRSGPVVHISRRLTGVSRGERAGAGCDVLIRRPRAASRPGSHPPDRWPGEVRAGAAWPRQGWSCSLRCRRR